MVPIDKRKEKCLLRPQSKRDNRALVHFGDLEFFVIPNPVERRLFPVERDKKKQKKEKRQRKCDLNVFALE